MTMITVMSHRRKRILFVILLLMALSTVTGLILLALKQNINLFFTPTQLISETKLNNKKTLKIRLGGMVEKGSVKRGDDLAVKFVITDFEQSILVEYKGILPDLFREGQGIVVQGRFIEGIFKAETVLAKHDEQYMPTIRRLN